ncbi:MAG: hypothetical protein K5739_12825 [Lachnospiraceae bacterium]|nr:hypothetical protein [Lachnospiraceae bacterium]
MKLSDNLNGNNDNDKAPLLYLMLAAAGTVLVIVLIVLMVNDKVKTKQGNAAPDSDAMASEDAAEAGSGDNLTADDLDFWDMYKKDQSVSDNKVITDKSYEDRMKEKAAEEEEAQEDLSEGGTKTKVVRPDGTEQWVMINAYINPNKYKEECFVYKDPMMKYITEGKTVSEQGVMLDEKDGAVDFALLKQAGIQFVMLRFGYRGYETGKLKKDEWFDDHLKAATDAGIMVGVYFESAAKDEQEAIEEAAFVMKGLSDLQTGVTDQTACVEPADSAATASDLIASTTAEGTADRTQKNIAEAGKQNQEEEKNNGEWMTGAVKASQDGDSVELPDEPKDEEKTDVQTDGQGTQTEGAVDVTDAVVVEQIGDQIQESQDQSPELPVQEEEEEEKVEEISINELVKNRSITYPVAIKLGQPANHSSRTDSLPKTMVSLIANTYTKMIRQKGYKPIVWADKYWLLRRADLTQFTQGTEVVLEQMGTVPDYPYEFSLWQYQSNGKIQGLQKEVRMMMSFVDFKAG